MRFQRKKEITINVCVNVCVCVCVNVCVCMCVCLCVRDESVLMRERETVSSPMTHMEGKYRGEGHVT